LLFQDRTCLSKGCPETTKGPRSEALCFCEASPQREGSGFTCGPSGAEPIPLSYGFQIGFLLPMVPVSLSYGLQIGFLSPMFSCSFEPLLPVGIPLCLRTLIVIFCTYEVLFLSP